MLLVRGAAPSPQTQNRRLVCSGDRHWTCDRAPLGIRLHPTQIYEFLVELLIFLLLLWVFRHRSFEGQISALYLFLYGVARYFLEFLRADPDRGSMFGGIMSATQFIALLLVISGGVMWVLCSRPQGSRRSQLVTIA
ncbi:MAG: hypothetical protein DMG64_19555 [Acidobacteria bacterium]|nr:MAG: hypothetical protein DMG64_19555 [Acidobacteriota bacterium]